MLSLNWAPLSVYLFLTLVIGEHNMPTVPKSVGRTVAPAPISTPVQSIQPANVQPLAQGISQLGDALLRKRNRDEQTEASILDAEYAQTIRTTMFGDGSEDNPGYLSSQGLDAERNVGDAENSLKEAQAILLEGKSVGIQRRLIPMFAQRNNSAQTLMGRHVQAQNKVAEQAASDSRINSAAEDAVLLSQASDAQQLHIDIGVAEIASRGREQGLEQVTVDEQTREFVSAVHSGSIDSLLSQGLLNEADAYLVANDEAMLSAARDTSRNDIRIARERANTAVTAAQLATQDEFMGMLQDDSLTSSDILTSNLKPTGVGGKSWFLDRLQRQNREGVITDQSVFLDVLRRINLPRGAQERITDRDEILEQDGSISFADIGKLSKELENRDNHLTVQEKKLTDQFLKQGQVAIVGTNDRFHIKDQKGEELFNDFQAEFFRRYNDLRATGKQPSEAIEMLQSLLGDESIYIRTPQEAAADMVRGLGIQSDVGSTPPLVEESSTFTSFLSGLIGNDDTATPAPSGEEIVPQFNAQGQTPIPAPQGGTKSSTRIRAAGKTSSTVEFPQSDETLFRALVLTESMNDPSRISTAGAIGRFQVMPDTASKPGFGIAPAKKNEDGSFIPAELERVGRQYIKAMLKRYNNDMEAALIAYNAGPGNADKWVKAGRDYSVLPDRNQTEPYVQRFRRHLATIENRTSPTIDPNKAVSKAVSPSGEVIYKVDGKWRRLDGTIVE